MILRLSATDWNYTPRHQPHVQTEIFIFTWYRERNGLTAAWYTNLSSFFDRNHNKPQNNGRTQIKVNFWSSSSSLSISNFQRRQTNCGHGKKIWDIIWIGRLIDRIRFHQQNMITVDVIGRWSCWWILSHAQFSALSLIICKIKCPLYFFGGPSFE